MDSKANKSIQSSSSKLLSAEMRYALSSKRDALFSFDLPKKPVSKYNPKKFLVCELFNNDQMPPHKIWISIYAIVDLWLVPMLCAYFDNAGWFREMIDLRGDLINFNLDGDIIQCISEDAGTFTGYSVGSKNFGLDDFPIFETLRLDYGFTVWYEEDLYQKTTFTSNKNTPLQILGSAGIFVPANHNLTMNVNNKWQNRCFGAKTIGSGLTPPVNYVPPLEQKETDDENLELGEQQFPITIGLHAAFFDGFTYYMPNGWTVDSIVTRRVNRRLLENGAYPMKETTIAGTYYPAVLVFKPFIAISSLSVICVVALCSKLVAYGKSSEFPYFDFNEAQLKKAVKSEYGKVFRFNTDVSYLSRLGVASENMEVLNIKQLLGY